MLLLHGGRRALIVSSPQRTKKTATSVLFSHTSQQNCGLKPSLRSARCHVAKHKNNVSVLKCLIALTLQQPSEVVTVKGWILCVFSSMENVPFFFLNLNVQYRGSCDVNLLRDFHQHVLRHANNLTDHSLQFSFPCILTTLCQKKKKSTIHPCQHVLHHFKLSKVIFSMVG